MALDHFVPQVHLRRFLSRTLGTRLHAIRKRDGFRFSPRTQDVCRVEDGSSNPYLDQARAIEEFLKAIEPRYNEAVEAARRGASDSSHVEVLAGFTAYVASCSPAAMRVNAEPLRASVEAVAAIVEASGQLPPAPASLGGKTLTELVRDGTIDIKIDAKFPQAIGISRILDLSGWLESCDWEFLHSSSSAKAFPTSDFPVAIERPDPGRPMVRVVPLAPDLAVRIVPCRTTMARAREGYGMGKRWHRSAGGHEVVELSRTIVRSAEELVFFSDDLPWMGPFVEANRDYRVTATTTSAPTGHGSALMMAMGVSKMNR